MPREKVATRLSATSLQADALERGGDSLFALAVLETHQPCGVAQILRRGQIVIEADRIRQVADPALDLERLAHRIMAEHPHLACRDFGQPEHHQDRRGLAGAVGAEQTEDFALAHREGDAVRRRCWPYRLVRPWAAMTFSLIGGRTWQPRRP